MLVLSRKVGEEIIINGDVRVRVIATKAGSVRLGIEAPDHVRIDRKEIDDLRAEFAPRSDEELLFHAHSM